MSDNSSGLTAAILAYGQSQINQQNQQRENLANQLRNNELSNQNESLSNTNRRINDLNAELEDEIAIHQRRTREAWDLFRNERKERNRIVDKYNALLEEMKTLKKLLAQPMREIAEQNDDFKKTYEKQMESMAEWMVSQKAFKELAIRFGKEKGITPQEVIQMGLNMEIDVLEDRHDPEHNTKAGNSTIIRPYREKLKEKFYAERKKTIISEEI